MYLNTKLDRSLDASIARENRGERSQPGECVATDALNAFLSAPIEDVLTPDVLAGLPDATAQKLRASYPSLNQ